MGLAGVYLGYNASKALFHNAVAGVLRAPMSFFDTTPLGRIMNRFSKDIDTLDNTLNDSMRMAFATFASVLGAIILIAIVNPIFIVFLAGILCLYGLAALFYTKSARELKGMDNLLRSSLYAFVCPRPHLRCRRYLLTRLIVIAVFRDTLCKSRSVCGLVPS